VVEGAAELVVEILSPGDESYVKLDWYASPRCGRDAVPDAIRVTWSDGQADVTAG
jgi:hypothetical protein